MKDKCEALGRIESIEHDEQREPDGIGQDRLLLGINFFRDDGRRRRIRGGSGERLFAARIARATG